MASAKSVLDSLRPRAEVALAGLLNQPYEALFQLPAVDAKTIEGFPKRATLTTYRDALPDGRLRVVMQLFVQGILGTARIWAKGFFLLPGAQPVAATDEDLYDFF